MEHSALMDEVSVLLRGIFNDPGLDVSPQTSARDVPGWDSMKWVMILLAIEEKYDIEFTTRETDRFRNVGELVASIAGHLKARG